jgi:uncharacterized protein HemY
LAGLLRKEKSYGPALNQIKEGLKRSPRDPELNEQAGDVEKELSHTADATAFYQIALQHVVDPKMRRRIRVKSRTISERVSR